MRRICILAVMSAGVLAPALAAQDLNDQLEKMSKAAILKAAPCIVQIETRGGTDMVVAGPKGQVFRKAFGPTTGVIVGADGYIISSAFNFLNNPNIILVRIPGRADEPLVAQRVATDKSRMLTLLKVDAKGLPVATAVPKNELHEGQWAIALGRALDTKMERSPAVSVGIISALGRVWGKAIQTDAKISPINYGGPIIDIQGRVQGILIPASPREEDETAGFEWYDSGIGFAIPLTDVFAVLPRLKAGKDLHKGVLGIGMKDSKDIYAAVPQIGAVMKGSAAERAGLKPGDIIVEIEGKPVERMAQIQHYLGVKYEGDTIGLKYKRGGNVVEVKSIELVGTTIIVAQPFLGILPVRDDPKLGVEVRYVFPKSPAEKAGLKAGDRIVKYGPDEKTLILFDGKKRGKGQFLDWLNTIAPGTPIKLEVKRENGKTEMLAATLDYLPGALPGVLADIPEKLPEIASKKKGLEPLEMLNAKEAKVAAQNPAKAETGLLERKSPDGQNKYWLYVHDDYDPQVAHALLVWLHPPDKNKKEDMEAFQEMWEDYCKENQIILVMPVLNSDEGWIPSAAGMVVAATRDTMSHYSVDPQRVVAHGMGVGGQMAIHLGLNHRDLFHGVAAVGAAVVGQVKDNVAAQRVSFYLAGGELDPIVKSIAESRLRLAERRYPAVYRQIAERGREYLTDKHLSELVRWIDSLDRQ
jgi:S1-C subfamily serine protease